MSLFFSALLGFSAGFLSHTLFGSIAFYALAATYAYAIYSLFFSASSRFPFLFLIGLTLENELLGSAHFGQASFLAVCLSLIYYLFQQRLRFTSLFTRYIVALFLTLLAYDLFLFPWHSLLHRSEDLFLFFFPLAILSYFFFPRTISQDYEFI